MNTTNLLPCLLLSLAVACGTSEPSGVTEAVTTGEATDFSRDVEFLRGYDSTVVVLERDGAALVASAKYQGKVFTSTTGGGESQGFINYDAFAVDPPAAHINAYGGEQRLWVGPEGGPQAIFFPPDSEFNSAVWQTPAPIDHEPWTLVEADEHSVAFTKQARFDNRAGENFDVRLDRRVELLSDLEIKAAFPQMTADNLARVGYLTDNVITNVGEEAWTPERGTVSLWLLDILPAGDSVVAILPYRNATPATLDTTNAGYFGTTAPERLRVVEGAVLFRGDGAEVGKVGLPVRYATGRLGSVDLERGVLTVIEYDYDPAARYQGMEWRELDDPYAGDAVTTYNNGAAPAKPSFYELESIAPAAFLAPGESAPHEHTVYHFEGEPARVLEMAEALLGVEAAEVMDFAGLGG